MNGTTESWNISSTSSLEDATTQTFMAMHVIYKEHLPVIYEIPKIVKAIMYVFGFPGNILACIMWLQRPLLHSSGCYLASLAISDLLFLVLSMMFDLEYIWEIKTIGVPVVCQAFPVIYMAVQYMSPLLTMAFTVERFISVRFPLGRRIYCTVKRAAMVILFLALFVLVAGGIQAYIWDYDYTHHACDIRIGIDEFRKHWTWITESTMFILVPVMILGMNVLLIFTIRRSKRRARHLYGSPPKHRSATTEMLLVVSFYLIFTTLPVTILYALGDFFPPNPEVYENVSQDPVWQSHFKYMVVREAVYAIGISHYVCNFYLYLATGHRFRMETKRYFQHIVKKG
ncbi:pyrokinin-1 receptor-like [Mizuhopecten yessoensis]|uniref:Growth hormone secretagogue receptor type 1 n=1 Tax=Mizuhopecten yessoensis TaxID=6573 RepID=A0A210QZC5_MIZYE|nr:pyrokinin-1 receptor-like [Mizuhopecten yessoensis]OWF54077.1 Growth hormone secretagogue receptor type 1 [Mizuhopecten yessoensis]